VGLNPGPGRSRHSRLVDAGAALLVASLALVIVEALTGSSAVLVLWIIAALLVSATAIGRIVEMFERRLMHRLPTRIAVIGSAAVARRLQDDLDHSSRRYRLIGRIALPGDADGATTALATLDGLRRAVVEHDIRLLILSSGAPRLLVFDELVSRCLDLPVQLVELTSFYEATFGCVPISEMNAVWFQYLVDPASRFPDRLAKRTSDMLAAVVLAVPVSLLCAVLIVLIRRDGGPGLFRQERIGEGGRPFTLYKLRTMSPCTGTDAQWADIDDPRITSTGRLLRCTHLDELPQLLNVVRGDMSLVGPRPEQPALVERLEHEVPFYQRRHLLRPGITGWAQIHCGYARSDSGSVWKHCHDLYYLKHRSTRLDLWILAVTSRLAVLGAIRGREAITKPSAPVEIVAAQTALEPNAAHLVTGGNRPPAPT
jgi:lipopolysaccharide/colanic/teichoic acid biosynthesis glycosyltransferase